MPIRQKYLTLIGATMAWVAVILQFYLMIDNRIASVTETIIRFFSYFTILTNTLVALYFTIALVYSNTQISLFKKPGVLTSITIYITVVGLVYQTVLRSVWEPQGLQMIVDELLHTVNPVFFILFWILYEQKSQVKWNQIPGWLIYPLVYIVCILLRGALSGFYPYPFIDASVLNLMHLTRNIIILCSVFIILSTIFIWFGKLKSKH